jgi:hypothetical protein
MSHKRKPSWNSQPSWDDKSSSEYETFFDTPPLHSTSTSGDDEKTELPNISQRKRARFDYSSTWTQLTDGFAEDSGQEELSLGSLPLPFVDSEEEANSSEDYPLPISTWNRDTIGEESIYTEAKVEGNNYLKEAFGKKGQSLKQREKSIVKPTSLSKPFEVDPIITTTTSTTAVAPDTIPHSLAKDENKKKINLPPPLQEEPSLFSMAEVKEKKHRRSFKPPRRAERETVVPESPKTKQMLEDEALARRLQDEFVPSFGHSEARREPQPTEPNSAEDADALLARQLQIEEQNKVRGYGRGMYPPSRPQRHVHRHFEPAQVHEEAPTGGGFPFGGFGSFASFFGGGAPQPTPFGRSGFLSQFFSRYRGSSADDPERARNINMLRLSLTNRDFNENDYEMLLQLDEAVKKGADKRTIGSLPAYTLEKMESVVTCCICLTDMEEGAEVRKLPCNHFFHKECIDEWLAVNKSCPIDKKQIDES